MPIIHIETDNAIDADIYFWKIEESCEELARLFDKGDIMLADAAKRFKSVKRQQEWLATRALLMQTPYRDTSIQYRSNGQPYLADSSMYISISHTAEFVAVAIAGTPVGIDIEMKNRNAHSAAKAYLQPQEIETVNSSKEPHKEALRLWTAKEAAFKLNPAYSTVIKEIATEKAAENGSSTVYRIAYKNGTTATCRTTEHNSFILSVCTAN